MKKFNVATILSEVPQEAEGAHFKVWGTHSTIDRGLLQIFLEERLIFSGDARFWWIFMVEDLQHEINSMSKNRAVAAEGKLIKVPCTFEGTSLQANLQNSLVEVHIGDEIFEGKITNVTHSDDGCDVEIVPVSSEERTLKIDIDWMESKYRSIEIPGTQIGYVAYQRSKDGVVKIVGAPRNKITSPTKILAYSPGIEAPLEFQIVGLSEIPLGDGKSYFCADLIG